MIDREKLTNHIKDVDLKNTLYKICDKVTSVLKNHDIRYTDFLNPYEVKNAVGMLYSIEDINYSIYGGYKESERKIICIYPYYLNEEKIISPIKVLEIKGNFKFKEISHRDYLGSILGLGIKREKIGDILIQENLCQMIVHKDIFDFLQLNLEKVGKNVIQTKEIFDFDIHYSPPKYKEIYCTVSSNRLDAILSGIYNLSRQESSKYIIGQRVYVDFEPIYNPSKIIKEGSLLSVRGKGRSIISEIGDLTKKGRIKIKAKTII